MADFRTSELRTLASLPAVDATMLKGALEVEGITVVLDDRGASGVYPMGIGTWATRVMVTADQFDQARRILDRIEGDADR